MKKIIFALCFTLIDIYSFGQLADPGFESWVSGTSGSTHPIVVNAPSGWNGVDSLIIYSGESFGTFIGAGSNWHAQIFQESTKVHSGTYSAKLMTLKQDTLGYFPAILLNAKPILNVTALLSILGGGGTGISPTNLLTYSGGTAITNKIRSVNAWVQYARGKDSTGNMGIDSGSLLVNVLANVGGKDSIVGIGTVKFDSTSTWKQVTANIVYTDTIDVPDSVRIFILSSAGGRALDSSTLWADDISINYALGVNDVIKNNNVVNVYPNPTTNKIYFRTSLNESLTFKLFTLSGQLLSIKHFTGNDHLDISHIPQGMYYYSIFNNTNQVIQTGKVSVI